MKANKIWIKHTLGIIAVNPKEILYIEGYKHNCTVYYCKKDNFENLKSIISRITITTFEKELNIYGFIRCHRNFIINPLIIDNYTPRDSFISLNDGIIIPISRRKQILITNLINQKHNYETK